MHCIVDSNDLEGEPCEIEHSDDATPVCEQLLTYAQKIIASANEMMIPLLNLLGVVDKEKSPF